MSVGLYKCRYVQMVGCTDIYLYITTNRPRGQGYAGAVPAVWGRCGYAPDLAVLEAVRKLCVKAQDPDILIRLNE